MCKNCLLSEIVEQNHVGGYPKAVEHPLCCVCHRAGSAHIVFDIFGRVVIFQIGVVNYLMHKTRCDFTPAASAAGSGRSSAR